MSYRRTRWLALLVVCVIVWTSCQARPGPGIVGRWRNWDGYFYIVFAADGEVTYELDFTSEEHWTFFHGSYQVISEDSIYIEIDYEESGEYQYIIEGDTLQLTSASGKRMTFRRAKQTSQ